MPAVSKSQFALMKAASEGEKWALDKIAPMTKEQAAEYVSGQSPEDLPERVEKEAGKNDKDKKKKGNPYSLEEVDGKMKVERYAVLDIDDEMKKKLADIVIEQVDSAKNNKDREAFIKDLEVCRKRYEMEDLDTDWPWENASKRRTGGLTIAIDRVRPRIKKALFYSGRIIDVEPVSPEDPSAKEIAEKKERWMDAILRDEMDIETGFEPVLFDALTMNFGVMKNSWFKDDKVSDEVKSFSSPEELLAEFSDANTTYPSIIERLSSGKQVTLRIHKEDHISKMKAEWVDPNDIIYPEGIKDDKDAWIIIQKQKARRDELLKKQKQKFFENVDALWSKKEDENEGKDLGKQYEYFEAIVNYDVDGDGFEEKVVVWVGKVAESGGNDDAKGGANVYLRGIKYPYNHYQNYFIIFRSMVSRFGFYSGGLFRKLRSINEAEDRRVNQLYNAADQAIIKSWVHKKIPGSPFRAKEHKFYPGVIWDTAGGQDEITEMRMSDVPVSSFNLLSDNRMENELLSGIPQSYMTGLEAPRDRQAPARKAELMLAEGNITVSEFLKSVARGIQSLAEQVLSAYQQFTESNAPLQTPGGAVVLERAEAVVKTKFTCRSMVESVTQQEKAQSNIALYSTVVNDPLIASNIPIRWEMLKGIIGNWSEEWSRLSDKIFSEKNLAKLTEQAEQAQQQVAQQQGRAPV